jgi:hypothetical protein
MERGAGFTTGKVSEKLNITENHPLYDRRSIRVDVKVRSVCIFATIILPFAAIQDSRRQVRIGRVARVRICGCNASINAFTRISETNADIKRTLSTK